MLLRIKMRVSPLTIYKEWLSSRMSGSGTQLERKILCYVGLIFGLIQMSRWHLLVNLAVARARLSTWWCDSMMSILERSRSMVSTSKSTICTLYVRRSRSSCKSQVSSTIPYWKIFYTVNLTPQTPRLNTRLRLPTVKSLSIKAFSRVWMRRQEAFSNSWKTTREKWNYLLES